MTLALVVAASTALGFAGGVASCWWVAQRLLPLERVEVRREDA